MITRKHSFGLFLITASMLFAAEAVAQTVFKCAVGGKTVYQSEPCPGQGKPMDIVVTQPTEQEVQEAKNRLLREQNNTSGVLGQAVADANRADQRRIQAAQHAEQKKSKCAALSQRRAMAYGHRNSVIRGQGGNVGQAMGDISNAESKMREVGCTMD